MKKKSFKKLRLSKKSVSNLNEMKVKGGLEAQLGSVLNVCLTSKNADHCIAIISRCDGSHCFTNDPNDPHCR